MEQLEDVCWADKHVVDEDEIRREGRVRRALMCPSFLEKWGIGGVVVDEGGDGNVAIDGELLYPVYVGPVG